MIRKLARIHEIIRIEPSIKALNKSASSTAKP